MNVFIHAGMPKTATSFLQRGVFPFLPEHTLVLRETQTIPQLRKPVRSYENLLISDEELLGIAFLSGTAITNRGSREAERNQVIANAKNLYPQARFILGYRRHSDFVLSLYKQYLHMGGTLPVEKFVDIDADEGYISLDELYYQPIIDQIVDNFPASPFIYRFDDFVENRVGLLTGLFNYLGSSANAQRFAGTATVNRGVEHYQSRLLRRLNQVSKTDLSPHGLPLYHRLLRKARLDPRAICQERLSAVFRKKLQLPATIREYIDLHFAADWRYVSERAFVAPANQGQPLNADCAARSRSLSANAGSSWL